MAITQRDRDRLEDLQLDPTADRTDDLVGANEETPPTPESWRIGVEGDHITTQQGESNVQPEYNV